MRFLFDDDALYIGAKMYDTEGGKGVTTRLVRRDGQFDSDYFELVIDGYHDHLSRAFFDFNPSGSKGDYIGIGTSCCDASWDPVWEAATHIDEDGWTAEIRIPYSQLRFSRDSSADVGLAGAALHQAPQRAGSVVVVEQERSGGPPRFGHLEGCTFRASRRASRAAAVRREQVVDRSRTASGDPFNTHGRPTMRAGLDLKDRLTSNLTLDATFNPDFGQVEVDPAVLNLSAFETFFPEKRPFFVEGSQVFDFGRLQLQLLQQHRGDERVLFAPHRPRADRASLATDPNLYADVPDATTILGAGKITGRTSSGYTSDCSTR